MYEAEKINYVRLSSEIKIIKFSIKVKKYIKKDKLKLNTALFKIT